jgi:hypothetical protein
MHIDFCGRADGGSTYARYIRVCAFKTRPRGILPEREQKKRLGRKKKKNKEAASTINNDFGIKRLKALRGLFLLFFFFVYFFAMYRKISDRTPCVGETGAISDTFCFSAAKCFKI